MLISIRLLKHDETKPVSHRCNCHFVLLNYEGADTCFKGLLLLVPEICAGKSDLLSGRPRANISRMCYLHGATFSGETTRSSFMYHVMYAYARQTVSENKFC